jgi:hypothetical protein
MVWRSPGDQDMESTRPGERRGVTVTGERRGVSGVSPTWLCGTTSGSRLDARRLLYRPNQKFTSDQTPGISPT